MLSTINNKKPIVPLLLITGFFIAICYFALPIIKPFIISFTFAYFLNYFVELLLKTLKISRNIAVTFVFLVFTCIFLFLIIWLMPKLLLQIAMLLSNLPKYLQQLTINFEPLLSKIFANNPFVTYSEFNANIRSKIFEYFSDSVKNISTAVFHYSINIFNVFSIIIIIPILTFYFLKDYTIIINYIKKQLPKKHYRSTIKFFRDIDNILSLYLHGQLNVCLILAGFYGILLQLIGLKFGLIIGILTGLFSFIPFVAVISGLATAIAIAIFYWGINIPYLLLIIGIFGIGQFIEGNFITPKLIGDKIGVHPMWIIFGLFFFGSLFGFWGILLAMPLISIFSVISRHIFAFCRQYLT